MVPTRSKAHAPACVVATGHPRVTEAACEILRAGGNAFDAAVAAGFCSSVAEPALSSLGGGGFLLARTAAGRATLFDFFVDTPGRGLPAGAGEPHLLPVTVRFPSSEQVFHAGLGSVAVPGTLRGLLHVHASCGRLPLAEVVAPAVSLARDGVTLNDKQAYFLGLLEPIMTLRPDGRALFERDGRYVAAGETFTNPELAAFMESLVTDGDRALYEGELARRVADDMSAGAGLLTAADLAAYRVIERAPLTVGYRGVSVLTNPPPSFGGSLLALSLRLLDGDEAAPGGSGAGIDAVGDFGSARHLASLAACMQEVDRLRASGVTGPDDLEGRQLATARGRVRTATGGTTHVSISDAEGNVASMTTSNGEGSGYLVPGTGVMLNNMMGEDDLHPDGFHACPAGQRVASMMSPSLILDGDDVRLVIGSGGSKRIRTALLQVLSNVIDFGMDVAGAVDSPRVHWDGDRLQIEPGFEAGVLAELAATLPVNRWDVLDVYFGGVNAVEPDTAGAADPRRGGHAATVSLR